MNTERASVRPSVAVCQSCSSLTATLTEGRKQEGKEGKEAFLGTDRPNGQTTKLRSLHAAAAAAPTAALSCNL